MKFNIGDSFVGFKFNENYGPGYDTCMDSYIGIAGKIVDIDNYDNTVRVLFPDGEDWWYPIDEEFLEVSKDTGDARGVELKDQFNIDSLKITAYAVVNTKGKSTISIEYSRDNARMSLRDAKALWPEDAKSFKIVKLKADKFIR